MSLNLKFIDIKFIKKYYKEQIDALNSFLPVINESFAHKNNKDFISFGGGTALAMYYFRHRLSFDIDLFINDAQQLAFLSPKLWLLENDDFSPYYKELAHHISLRSKNGTKIDILVRKDSKAPMLDNSKKIFKDNIYIRSIEDIISDKIIFRKFDNKARDIFDIATSLEEMPYFLETLLHKNMIEIQDLKDLRFALKTIDKAIFKKHIKIIKPCREFQNLAINSIQILKSHIDKIL